MHRPGPVSPSMRDLAEALKELADGGEQGELNL
jgi:hypothetical protein